MTIPAAIFLEMADAMLAAGDLRATAGKVRELRSAAATDSQYPSLVKGYLPGLKTAEILLAGRGLEL
jgi:hypothetical protein